MANLHIRGVVDILYANLKDFTASKNRSVSQQVLFVIN